MKLDQTKDDVRLLQCVHSKAASKLQPNWEDYWIVRIEDTDMSYKVLCNPDILVQTFLEEDQFLSAIQVDGQITLLFTVGRKQKFPLCSKINCSKQVKCFCFKKSRLDKNQTWMNTF